MDRKPMLVGLLIAALIAQPLRAAGETPPEPTAQEIAAMTTYGPLGYRPASDCQPAYCSESIQTVESTDGGGAAPTQMSWVVIAVIVVLVVAVAAGGSGGGGGGY